MYFLALILILLVNQCVNCFNIDTNFPIIYSDPNVNARINKSYFGYSVILYDGANDGNPWIQIGAPKGHDSLRYSGYTKPGLIYRCGIKEPCGLFLVDTQWSSPPKRPTGRWPNHYIPKKDGAWIGASMDIDFNRKQLIVCAPRWINSKDSEYFIQGACYWSNLVENNTRSLLPLVNDSAVLKDSIYHYPMGQAGMSVHIPNTNNAAIVLGAPGVYNWKGTIISYQNDFRSYTVVEASNIKDLHSFNYLGYSISSGYFFSSSQLSYVAGAPRGSFIKGTVLVFNYERYNLQNIKVRQIRTGENIGDYFGAAIGVADINGDGLDDLIIGAPHFSVRNDEGRIYICYGNRNNVFLPADQSLHITGNYTGGQFGLAIQSLGDIDDDGCDDFAVGAPYEDDDHGVIYIYKGVKTTTANPILVQRIEGKKLYPNLRGFGISFSKPADIDQNKVKDIAVGSFLSDNAVILRMRPVVVLEMNVKSFSSELDRKSQEFFIQTCFKYSGKKLPIRLNITRKVVLDNNLQRAYQKNFPNNQNKYENTIELVFNKMTCHNMSIVLKTTLNVKNSWEPIEIAVSQNIIEQEVTTTPLLVPMINKTADLFCKSCPVVNKAKSTREIKIDVPFALNCGIDNICHSNLEISAEFKDIRNDEYIIGVEKKLPLEINVTNTNESAYFTEVSVLLPENVLLLSKPTTCDEKHMNNKILVVCFIDNPLERGKLGNITLDLDMYLINELPRIDLPLSFQINVTTSSQDITPEKNIITKYLTLTRDADIKITGNMEDTNSFGINSLSNATVVYEVQKSGVSPINEFTFNVTIPVAYKKNGKEIHFMAIRRPLGLQNQQPLTCSWPEEYFRDAEVFEGVVQNFRENTNRSKRETSEDVNQTISEAPRDKIKYINCDLKQVVCKTVSCIIGPFNKMLRTASLQIKMVLNGTELNKIVGADKGIYLSTIGTVQEIDGILSDKVIISSTFVKEFDDKLDTWIIIISVASGILILLFIILGLVKAGFFERKQKAELEALKQKEVEEEFMVQEPSTECVTENEDEDL